MGNELNKLNCCDHISDDLAKWQADLTTDTKPKLFNTISEKDLIEYGQSGDLLLYNTNNPMAKLQRAFLWSDFDHVAILIKSESVKDDIFLLEAVSTGVRLIKWSNIREFIGRDDPDKFFS